MTPQFKKSLSGRKWAAGYVRVSTEEQAKYGYSLDEQRLAIEDWCREKGFAITWFVDEGISGRKVNRPAYCRAT